MARRLARIWGLALLVVAAAATLAAPWGALAAHGGVHVPPARVGDRAMYASADGDDAKAFGFEWQPREATRDAWGRPVDVDVLASVVPARRYDLAEEAWMLMREAFAGDAGDPVWRRSEVRTSWAEGTRWYGVPLAYVGVPAFQDITRTDNVTSTAYAPRPLLESCLAYHTLGGRSVGAGLRVDLADLCPVAFARRGLEAEPLGASATAFHGRPAVQLEYRVRVGDEVEADLPPFDGTLRLVFADGLPFAVEAEARNATDLGGWRYVLSGLTPGSGAPVRVGAPRPAPAEPGPPEGATFVPASAEGPVDGGSGLVYTFEEAMARLRADRSLVQWGPWMAAHPDAFVAEASFSHQEDGQQGFRVATWRIAFQDPHPGPDGLVEDYHLASQFRYAEAAPRVGGKPAGWTFNWEMRPWVSAVRHARPDGEAVLDVAGALRVAAGHLPFPLTTDRVRGLDYATPVVEAPGLRTGRPALMSVEAYPSEDAWRDFDRTTVVLDAGRAVPLAVQEVQQRSVFGPPLQVDSLDDAVAMLSARDGERRGEPFGFGPAALPGVVGLTLLAVLAAVLAHAGYVTVAYSRLKESDLLAHPTRRRVYDLVRARPGLHLLGIVEALGAGRNTVLYHLRVLERGGLVTHVALRKFRRYYVTGTVPSGALRGEAELQGGSARAVYGTVQAEPGLTLADIGQRVGLSREAVRRTVDRLAAAGLLEKHQDGHFVRVVERQAARQN